MAGLCAPLSTLRRCPRGHLRMTRGRCGSLLLHRDGLAPSTPCRSPGALRFTPESGLNSDIAPSPKSAMYGQVGDQPTVIPGIARRRPSTHLATSSGRRMGIRSTRLDTRDAGPSSRRKRAALVECHADPLFPAPYDVAAQPSGTKLAAPATRRL